MDRELSIFNFSVHLDSLGFTLMSTTPERSGPDSRNGTHEDTLGRKAAKRRKVEQACLVRSSARTMPGSTCSFWSSIAAGPIWCATVVGRALAV